MPVLNVRDPNTGQYVPIIGSGITQPDADARYVKQSGDTMTGTLDVPLVNAEDVSATNVNSTLAAAFYLICASGGSVEFTGPNGVLKRYLAMNTASNGLDGIRILQDANANTLGPLGVMDPNLPEHAATRGWTHNIFRTNTAITPLVKTINSGTIQNVCTSTITPQPGTTVDLVFAMGWLMLSTPTATVSFEAAVTVNGLYAPGRHRQTMPTGSGNYQTLMPGGCLAVTHNGAAYPVTLQAWIATGSGTASTTADSRYNVVSAVAVSIA
jgi:hypothetical protein